MGYGSRERAFSGFFGMYGEAQPYCLISESVDWIRQITLGKTELLSCLSGRRSHFKILRLSDVLQIYSIYLLYNFAYHQMFQKWVQRPLVWVRRWSYRTRFRLFGKRKGTSVKEKGGSKKRHTIWGMPKSGTMTLEYLALRTEEEALDELRLPDSGTKQREPVAVNYPSSPANRTYLWRGHWLRGRQKC